MKKEPYSFELKQAHAAHISDDYLDDFVGTTESIRTWNGSARPTEFVMLPDFAAGYIKHGSRSE